MSIRDLSLKELRVLAQQQLGAGAAQLKTRQELVDGLEAHAARLARPLPKPRTPPLPAPVVPAPPPRELPPEPVIWTGATEQPRITAQPVEPAQVVIRDFFKPPARADGLPDRYGDDRVLSFEREPGATYAAWDFSDQTFAQGEASGRVLDREGEVVSTFKVAEPTGGAFLSKLPPGLPLRIEIRSGERLLGETGWLVLPAEGKPRPSPPSSSVV